MAFELIKVFIIYKTIIIMGCGCGKKVQKTTVRKTPAMTPKRAIIARRIVKKKS